MSWRELLSEATATLGEPGEARFLLEEAAGTPFAALLTRLDDPAPAPRRDRFATLLARRRSGEPLQHVLGHWGFRHLELVVDRRALVPRPETELVCGHALDELARIRQTRRAPGLCALDLGTGSGAIACALVTEADDLTVVGTDVSADALALAGENRARLAPSAAARLELVAGQWYAALDPARFGRVDCIVANPPYLAEAEWADLDPVVRDFDPYGALVAGPTGTEDVATIVAGAPEVLREGGALVVEIAPHQERTVLALAEAAGFVESYVARDLAGRPRVLLARR